MIDGDIDIATDPLPGDELHRFMRWARETAPVVRLPHLGDRGYLITRYDDLRNMFVDEAGFPGEVAYQRMVVPLIGETFLSMEVPRHDLYRQLATPAFRSRAVTRFVEEQLVPLAHELIDTFADRGQADLVAELARPLPSFAICRKLGLPTDDELRLRELALSMFGQRSSVLTPQEAAAEISTIIEPLLAARRGSPRDDVLSQLAVAEREGIQLSDEQIVNHVRLLFAAGAGNTSDAIALLLWALLTEPGVLEAAAEPAARDGIVHEIFRFEPVIAVLVRVAGTGATVAGNDLPAGSWVLAGIAAANRDPERFDDPDRFDPHRPPGELLTFGFGSKFCAGAHLARHELRAVLNVVLDRLPNLSLVHADEPVGGQTRTCPSVVARWG
jgi:cytochrome P450